MQTKILSRVAPAIALGLLVMVVWVLPHQLRGFRYHDMMRSIAAIPSRRLCLACMLTVRSYLVLTGYDALALHYLRHLLKYGKIALASFVGYVFSYNIGLSVLGGSAVRFRFYSAWGLSTAEISKVVDFCTLTFWIGVLTVAGVALLLCAARRSRGGAVERRRSLLSERVAFIQVKRYTLSVFAESGYGVSASPFDRWPGLAF